METEPGMARQQQEVTDFIFDEKSLTKEYWDRVNKDMKVKADNPV